MAATPFPEGIFEELDAKVGAPPRKVSGRRLKRLAIQGPSWLTEDRDVFESVSKLPLLLREGRLAWGGLVQANMSLFDPGDDDCPAVLAIDVEHRFEHDPRPLRIMAKDLFKRKGKTGLPPDEQAAGDLLEAETANIFFQPIPEGIAGDSGVHWSAVMFFRSHMPHGRITTGYMPVLWHPEVRVAAVLPGEFWTDRYLRLTYPSPRVDRLDR